LSARVLSGKEVATVVRSEVKERVAALAEKSRSVGLATVLVGEDAASQVYVRGKHRAATEAGMLSFDRTLPADTTQDRVESLIKELNEDTSVDGMIVQLPLPEGLDGNRAVELIAPAKDADGLHPDSLGRLVLDRPGPRPATPAGIMRILSHYEVETSGKLAVVIGRSFLVGRPMSLLLSVKGVDCTVVQTHSRTPDLPGVCRDADILIVAIGRANLVTADFVKPGATIIDVGINRTDEGLVGDVDYDGVFDIAGAITPVPGGVGPMTIASLLENTVSAAERTAEAVGA
jgi:methylenetetrahydrofolate dehydrogenase (NADP+)/methenyltetrahydrofolate cyclohydrolase